jgi:germination protein M
VKPAKLIVGILGVIVTLAVAWVLFVGLPRWSARRQQPPPEEPAAATVATPAPAQEPSAPRIKAQLLYVNDDGLRLRAEEREVPFGDTTAEQARRIVEAELEPVEPPLVSAIPAGTTLRGIYLGAQGEAYVDLSGEVSKNHPGGSQDELLTVYAIVDTVTINLPAVTAVQILIDGQEVDTLAGHVDLRRPLPKNTDLIEPPQQ